MEVLGKVQKRLHHPSSIKGMCVCPAVHLCKGPEAGVSGCGAQQGAEYLQQPEDPMSLWTAVRV